MTAAVQAAGTATDPQPAWTFPVPLERSDRREELTDAERSALLELGPKALRRNRARGIPRRTATQWKALTHLVEPLDTARAGLHHGDDIRFRRGGAHAAATIFIAKRHHRGRAWGFTQVYRSPNELDLISLNGIVVAPRPNRAWRVPVERRR